MERPILLPKFECVTLGMLPKTLRWARFCLGYGWIALSRKVFPVALYVVVSMVFRH